MRVTNHVLSKISATPTVRNACKIQFATPSSRTRKVSAAALENCNTIARATAAEPALVGSGNICGKNAACPAYSHEMFRYRSETITACHLLLLCLLRLEPE